MSYLVLARKYRPAALLRAGRPGARRADARRTPSRRAASTTRSCSPARAASARPARRASSPRRSSLREGRRPPSRAATCDLCQEIAGGRSRRRHRDRRGLEHEASTRSQVDPRGRALPAGARAAQGLHHRRSAHAVGAAFNALLKTLEEPPPHVMFVFATTEAHKIPVTILSRCQRFDFKLMLDGAASSSTSTTSSTTEKIDGDAGRGPPDRAPGGRVGARRACRCSTRRSRTSRPRR